MNLLITGGTGFLGSYFARYALLSERSSNIVVLDKYIDRARIEDILDRTAVVQGDVTDLKSVTSVIEKHGIDHIAHCAFILGSPLVGQMIPYVGVQIQGTANVLEAARLARVKRVLFCSSVAVYGKQETERLTEDLVVNPTEPYGASKAWGEALGRHYTRDLGLEVVSLRFGSTYGLGRAKRGSYRSDLVSVPKQVHYMARVEQAVRGHPIEMPRDEVLADFTYAMDAAQAAWRALTVERLPHHVYNVTAEQRRIGDFTQAMREVLPDVSIRSSETELPGHAHAHMDGRRLREDLGFTPQYSLKSGLEDYVRRVRE